MFADAHALPSATPAVDATTVSASALAVARHAGYREGSLRTRLHRALAVLRRRQFRFTAERIHLEFSHEASEHQDTLAHLRQAGPLAREFRFPEREQPRIAARIREALALIGDVDPDVREAMDVVVASLLLSRAPSPGGGGVSDVIGAIWLTPDPAWTTLDLAELLLHEYVHQALFLDDMVHRIFAAPLAVLAGEAARVESAVLRKRRDYDKAFHSAFVAFAVASLRRSLGLHALAEALLGPTAHTVRGLLAGQHLLTDHGRERLASLHRALDARHARLHAC